MASARFKLNGTNGATVGASVSPDAGSGYNLVGQSGITYSTTYAYEGTASITGTGPFVFFNDGTTGLYDTTNQVYVDFFAYVTTAPASDSLLVGGTYYDTAGLFMTTDRRLAFKDYMGTTYGQSSANLVPLNAWFRVRVRFDATNGADSAYLWTSTFTDDNPSTAGATLVTATASTTAGLICMGTKSSWYFDDIVVADVSGGNSTHVSATTHSGAAALSTASAITPAIAATRAAAAALSTTSAVTATAALSKTADAALSSTATLTATATRTAMIDAALSTTATLTATMDVTPPAGSVSGDAALSTTATLAATAALARPLDASLSTTATLAATAGLSRPLAAALSTALGISVSMIIEGQVPTTVGFMRGVSVVGPTIRPATGAASVPHIVALIGFDATTMRAHLSTTVTPSQYGLPLFAGGAVNPVAAGLIPSGTEYFWFNEAGELYHETGD